MQYNQDLESPHKDLFLAARDRLLAIDGVEEVKKERITTYFRCAQVTRYCECYAACAFPFK